MVSAEDFGALRAPRKLHASVGLRGTDVRTTSGTER